MAHAIFVVTCPAMGTIKLYSGVPPHLETQKRRQQRGSTTDVSNFIKHCSYSPRLLLVVKLLQHDAVEKLASVEDLHHQVVEMLLLVEVVQLHDVLVVNLGNIMKRGQLNDQPGGLCILPLATIRYPSRGRFHAVPFHEGENII